MKTRDFSNGKLCKPVCPNGFLKQTSFYQPSPVDVFLHRVHKSPHGGKSTRVTSDIYMLFNQQRLDRMTNQLLIQHFNDMSVQSPSMRDLRKRVSDDQLISLVKSRYIQSPSELLNWSYYLNSLADSELQKIVPADPKDPNDLKDPVTPSVTVNADPE